MLGVGFTWGEYSVGGVKSWGGELSRSNFTPRGFDRILMQILLIYLTFYLPIQFCMWRCSEGMVQGNFQCVWISQKICPWKGRFPEGLEKRLEINIFFNESFLRKNFQAESAIRNFTEKGWGFH